jgi:hypothetical protein
LASIPEESTEKKPRVRKVMIAATPDAVKRTRGRPKGSLGKKKRDAILEAEMARINAQRL